MGEQSWHNEVSRTESTYRVVGYLLLKKFIHYLILHYHNAPSQIPACKILKKSLSPGKALLVGMSLQQQG